MAGWMDGWRVCHQPPPPPLCHFSPRHPHILRAYSHRGSDTHTHTLTHMRAHTHSHTLSRPQLRQKESPLLQERQSSLAVMGCSSEASTQPQQLCSLIHSHWHVGREAARLKASANDPVRQSACTRQNRVDVGGGDAVTHLCCMHVTPTH